MFPGNVSVEGLTLTLIRDLWSPATIHFDSNLSGHRSSVTVVDHGNHLYQKHREAVTMSVFVTHVALVGELIYERRAWRLSRINRPAVTRVLLEYRLPN